MGDAAEIRAGYLRKQKAYRRDAAHILKLLIEDRFRRLRAVVTQFRTEQADLRVLDVLQPSAPAPPQMASDYTPE